MPCKLVPQLMRCKCPPLLVTSLVFLLLIFISILFLHFFFQPNSYLPFPYDPISINFFSFSKPHPPCFLCILFPHLIYFPIPYLYVLFPLSPSPFSKSASKMRSMLHQSAAEIAPSRSTNKYTKVSAAHYFVRSFLGLFIFTTVYFVRSFL